MAQEVGQAYVTLSARVAELEAGLARGSAAVNAFAAQNDAAAASTAAKWRATGASMQRIGRSMSKWITLPVVGAGLAGIKMAGDFEKSMAKVHGLVGVAKGDVQAMEPAIKDMAKAYGKGAAELGDAMFFITSAGLKGKDAMDALEQSTKASVAGLGDTKTVADLATSAMNAYKKSGLTATDATDVLTATVREGKLETEEIAGAMGRALPIASNLGVRFDEVGAALAAMSRTGTNAAEGVTQLRSIMTGLLKPTKAGTEAMQGVGLSYAGLRKQIKEKGLLSTLQTLTDALGDDAEAQAAVFQNVRALAGVMDMMGGNVDDTRKIFASMTDNAGDTNKAFEAMADTAAFRMQKAFAQLKAALLEVGQAIAPVVSFIAAGLSKIATAFTVLPGPIKNTIAAVAGLLALGGPLLMFAGRAASAFGSMGASLTGTAGKVGALGRAIAFIGMGSGPLGALIAGTALGITALVAFRNTTSAAQRAHEGYASALATSKEQQAAVTQQAGAAKAAASGVAGAVQAEKDATLRLAAAKRDLNQAKAEGQRANETDEQYASRIAALDSKVAKGKSDIAGNTSKLTSETLGYQATAQGLIASGQESIKTAKEQVSQFLGVGNSIMRAGASQEELAQSNRDGIAAVDNLDSSYSGYLDSLRQARKQGELAAKAIKDSALSDKDKAAALKPVKAGLRDVNQEIKRVEDAAGKTYTIRVQVNTKVVGGDPSVKRAMGGVVPGFAGGGTVRGPGGVDRVPAMLTAGEVVLTKRQQALVDDGMSIRGALMRTGGAFAKGGMVGPKRKPDESAGDYAKRRNEWLRNQRQGTTAAYQQVADAWTSGQLAKFDNETSTKLKGIEGKWRRHFDSIEASLGADTAAIEANFAGAFAALDTKSTAAFRNMDKAMRDAQRAMDATFAALTPAEAQLQALNDEASKAQLADQMSAAKQQLADANAAFEKASKWNNRDAMEDAKKQQVEARKAIAEAERAQVVADLTKTAEAERKAREEARVAAQDQFDEEWQGKRDALQTQLDGERAALQAQLDAQLAARRAAAETQKAEADAAQAAELATYQAGRDSERVLFEDKLITQGKAWARSRKMATGNVQTLHSEMERAARLMAGSGMRVGEALADGLASAGAAVRRNAAALAKIISDFLETHSPSRRGPLSNLDKWWGGFAPALVSGLDAGQVEAAAAGAVGPRMAGQRAAGGAGGTTTINLNITDQTFAGMSRDQADRVARDIQAALARRVSYSI